jgi:ATP-dependent Lon protease
MRQLERYVNKMCEKAALKLVRSGEERVVVSPENLKDFVGNPVFRK